MTPGGQAQIGNVDLVKQLNSAAVYRLIDQHGPISRIQIAEQSQLAPASVTKITRQLIERGLIKEVDQRVHNPYWKKLHDHIDSRTVDNWCDDHDQILKALIRKDPHAAKLAMWQHLENTKQMLFNETSDDFEFNADRYLFADNPVVHLDTATNVAK